MKSEKNLTILVFGGTGDLFITKILPSLKKVHASGIFGESVRFVAYGRRNFTDEGFQRFLAITRGDSVFLKRFSYVSGEIDTESGYRRLAEKLSDSENLLIYVALPPEKILQVAKGLRAAKITSRSRKNGFVRILIEKPFGNSLQSAKTLESELKKSFTDREIFRIDHYLAKNIIEAIPEFRKKNRLIEKRLSNTEVSDVRISLFETADVSGRAAFYDKVGAFLDVGQNHMLQMLAAVAAPISGRDRRKTLASLTPSRNGDEYVSAQYDGYQYENGVGKKSKTETYFSITACIDNPRFRGIPFHLESGKALKRNLVRIEITFTNGDMLRYTVQPQELIECIDTNGRIRAFDTTKYIPHSNFEGPYEKLFADAVAGKQSRFVSFKETIAEWKFAEKIQRKLAVTPIRIYPKYAEAEEIKGLL